MHSRRSSLSSRVLLLQQMEARRPPLIRPSASCTSSTSNKMVEGVAHMPAAAGAGVTAVAGAGETAAGAAAAAAATLEAALVQTAAEGGLAQRAVVATAAAGAAGASAGRMSRAGGAAAEGAVNSRRSSRQRCSSGRHGHSRPPCCRSCWLRRSGAAWFACCAACCAALQFDGLKSAAAVQLNGRACACVAVCLLLHVLHLLRAHAAHLTCVHRPLLILWCCRQDHSYLLQAFRFFVRNNFLLDYAAGAPLQLPPPPAYPPAAAPAWGRLPGGEGGAADGPAEVQLQQGQQDVRSLLATVAKDAIDVELSDEDMEEGLLPAVGAAQDGGAAAAAAAAGEADGSQEQDQEEEEEEGEESGSSSEEESLADDDAALEEEKQQPEEEGQHADGGTPIDAAELPLGGYGAAADAQQQVEEGGDAEDFIEFS